MHNMYFPPTYGVNHRARRSRWLMRLTGVISSIAVHRAPVLGFSSVRDLLLKVPCSAVILPHILVVKVRVDKLG